ncbi:signal transduction histidine kinase [Marisediminicola sp. UYEF4]|uniref:ATP-binding protein n=1 Tax=Marisediminicola sp. UYEF4 TaxID=1756384 RepID=UPI0033972C54
MAIAFSIGLVIALTNPAVFVSDLSLIGVGSLIMAGAIAVSIAFGMLGRESTWTLIVPGLSLVSIGLFRAGTPAGVEALFASLILLPVVWIAAEDGRRWIFVAALGSAASLMLPYVVSWAPPEDGVGWVRGILGPVSIGLGATVINELSRQGRLQLESIRALASERALLLAAAAESTERLRENEAHLLAADQLTRSVLDAVTEQSVIGTDLTGRIDVWNPGAAFMLGLAPSETQGRRSIFEFHLPDELERRSKELNYPPGETVLNPGFSALVETARLGRAEVREWTYVRHDGSRLPVEVAVTPRANAEGSTIGYIFVGTDLTRALEVARLKDEFIGLVSHELRTPLTSILGYLELLRDDDVAPLDEDQLQYLGIAERNAHRLLRLVGDLLFTAQVGSGKFPLSLSDVPLNDVVSGTIESAKPVAAAAGVELFVDLPDVSPLVRGDTIRLGQACDNLLSNAIKFTPRGGSVTVGLSVTGPDAVVTVRDTGMGIPADELDQLYSRFFRASTATRNAVAGVGLGLTITKAIVIAHGGNLDVESEEGVGTKFSMSLPVAT